MVEVVDAKLKDRGGGEGGGENKVIRWLLALILVLVFAIDYATILLILR